MEADLASLRTSVDSMRPGAGGGAFEWVDSVLVTALKSGHWLLVDNVNFCSASVLDRLNALLEPNGVLTINERGTVDGEIPTVVPHPNFRLFFAMDPKLGEISRAMRNRGIEIYILGEDEGQPYSKRDVLSMLTMSSGLTDSALCDWLLNLHEDIRVQTSVDDCPVLADLLQAGHMIGHLLQQGISRTEAAHHATHDVFVARRRTTTSKKETKTIVSEHLMRLPPPEISNQDNLLSLSTSCPEDTGDTMSVKKEGQILLALLQEMQSGSSMASDDSVERSTRLQTAALIFASVQGENNWQLSLEWLESMSASLCQLQGVKGPASGTVATTANSASASRAMDVDDSGLRAERVHLGFKRVRSLVAGCLKLIYEGEIWPKLKACLATTFGPSPQATSLLSEQAWDLNFNPQATRRAVTALKTVIQDAPSTQTTEQALCEAETIIQRLQLGLQAFMVAESLKERVERLEHTRPKSEYLACKTECLL
ncbi:midasin-like [Elysia marginata]|uniref:Midasin-like n=1 Tax=Elysia marginata TaxID=1093978 RepID=A0AAV4HC53_9GAST|nr:midasin-like [Elysia marginata]